MTGVVTPPDRGVRHPLPLAVWIIALAVFLCLMAVSARYGFHRDELYFVAAGRRLAWGYVDQPPLTPAIARLMDAFPGTISPSLLRIPAALSAATVVILGGMLTRVFGGDRRAMSVSAAFVAVGGFFLGVGHLLSTTTFDVLIWTAIITIVALIVAGGDQRLWLAVGALVGLGLLNKYTVGFLVVALLVALILTPQRRVLSGPMPWLGAGVALLIALPNLVWQASNGWPQLEMARSLRDASDGVADYLFLQIAILSFFMVIPAAAGWWWLLRDPIGRTWRVFPIAFLIVLVGFLVSGGKGYYVAALYVPLLSAGAVWLIDTTARTRVIVLGLVGVGAVVGFFIALPLVPASSVNAFNEINGELGETYGWNQLVTGVEDVYRSLEDAERSAVVIMTSNYGQAGAIELLSKDLPQPVSGHNTYWLWGPPATTGDVIILVGGFGNQFASLCEKIDAAGTVTNDAGVDNDENGTPIQLCRSPRASLATVWDDLRHYE